MASSGRICCLIEIDNILSSFCIIRSGKTMNYRLFLAFNTQCTSCSTTFSWEICPGQFDLKHLFLKGGRYSSCTCTLILINSEFGDDFKIAGETRNLQN